MANSVDPDQMLHDVASGLGLHGLLGLFVQIHRVNKIFVSSILKCISIVQRSV